MRDIDQHTSSLTPEPVDADWIRAKIAQIGDRRGVQAALARHTGLGRDKINKILQDRRRVSQEEAVAIRAFFCEPSEVRGIGNASGPTEPGDHALPDDAQRCIDAIHQAFDPSRKVVSLDQQDLRLLREAIEIFARLHGPDRPDDTQRLVNLLR